MVAVWIASTLGFAAALMVAAAWWLDERDRRIEAEWRDFDTKKFAASLLTLGLAAEETAMVLGAALIPGIREIGIRFEEWVERWETALRERRDRQLPDEPALVWWHRMMDMRKPPRGGLPA